MTLKNLKLNSNPPEFLAAPWGKRQPHPHLEACGPVRVRLEDAQRRPGRGRDALVVGEELHDRLHGLLQRQAAEGVFAQAARGQPLVALRPVHPPGLVEGVLILDQRVRRAPVDRAAPARPLLLESTRCTGCIGGCFSALPATPRPPVPGRPVALCRMQWLLPPLPAATAGLAGQGGVPARRAPLKILMRRLPLCSRSRRSPLARVHIPTALIAVHVILNVKGVLPLQPHLAGPPHAAAC
mmetsp:Transcript_53407/g.169850  ORF Transcript_53407/g.169850 Transcript_53407/m.169850 type:complete len:240 (-) Transcript_53407:841-1560(-)